MIRASERLIEFSEVSASPLGRLLKNRVISVVHRAQIGLGETRSPWRRRLGRWRRAARWEEPSTRGRWGSSPRHTPGRSHPPRPTSWGHSARPGAEWRYVMESLIGKWCNVWLKGDVMCDWPVMFVWLAGTVMFDWQVMFVWLTGGVMFDWQVV